MAFVYWSKRKMHDSSKFTSSGKQPEDGILLLLQPVSNGDNDVDNVKVPRVLTPKEGPGRSYNITTDCHTCSVALRVCVSATSEDIRNLQDLFLRGLSFYCPRCVALQKNGR